MNLQEACRTVLDLAELFQNYAKSKQFLDDLTLTGFVDASDKNTLEKSILELFSERILYQQETPKTLARKALRDELIASRLEARIRAKPPILETDETGFLHQGQANLSEQKETLEPQTDCEPQA